MLNALIASYAESSSNKSKDWKTGAYDMLMALCVLEHPDWGIDKSVDYIAETYADIVANRD